MLLIETNLRKIKLWTISKVQATELSMLLNFWVVQKINWEIYFDFLDDQGMN